MTFGDKLSKLRKENNYTQEQLADLLCVSRQSVSKWESDTAYPETDKLIRIGELFDCSLDYLLKDKTENFDPSKTNQNSISFSSIKPVKEKKSDKTIFGVPIWHIAKNARGIIAIGQSAHGVIAIGLRARGILSFGLLSFGLWSFGLLSAGFISAGMFTLGILSAGCFSAGIFAAGAITLGIISIGAVAVGDFSIGALAMGKYFALGDHAKAMIALGGSHADGSLFESIGRLDQEKIYAVKNLLDENVPHILNWAKEFIKLLL